jgi:hypothetical protein
VNLIRFTAVAAATLLSAGSATAQLLPGPGAEDTERLRAAEAMGLRLYRHDRAAALATDAVRAKRRYRNDKRLGGWITEARESSVLVSFVDKSDAQARTIIYQVEVADTKDGAGDVDALDPPKAMTESQQNALRARQTAVAFDFTPCANAYNTVVLPSTNEGTPGWSVFLLPATTDAKQIPFGGTYRLDVSADGSTVTSSRTYTRTCITFARNTRRAAREKEAALFVTHMLDPLPTEAHVLLNLTIGTVVVVMTAPNRSAWSIENGRIAFLKKFEEKPGDAPDVPIAEAR